MTSSSLPATEIGTERLVLRPWAPADVAAVNEVRRLPYWADDFPADGDGVIAGILALQPDELSGSGQRLVVERETGLVVGSIGLFWPPVADGEVEFGYGIVPSRRGRGYATEAAAAIVAFALAQPGVRRVHADVEVSNRASVRVLEKAGLRLWGSNGRTASFRISP